MLLATTSVLLQRSSTSFKFYGFLVSNVCISYLCWHQIKLSLSGVCVSSVCSSDTKSKVVVSMQDTATPRQVLVVVERFFTTKWHISNGNASFQ